MIKRSTFHLTFATPETILYDGPAISLTVPGLYGSFEVLANHAPIIALTHPGTTLLTTPAGQTRYTLEQGVFEVSQNNAFLLVDKSEKISNP